ncbi:MAG: transposase [Lachnospiraceae bacterium]
MLTAWEHDIKQFSYEICQRHKVSIRYMETDKDHIHYMIETEPTMPVSQIVNLMKSYTTYKIKVKKVVTANVKSV